MAALANPATWLAGYIPDLPTPFDVNGAIDLTAFERLCERQIKAGVSAIVAGETTGEASTLTPAEHEAIVRAAVEIARGRVRVIAGSGSNSTSQAIELTRRAETAGGGRYTHQPPQTKLLGRAGEGGGAGGVVLVRTLLQQADAGRHSGALSGHC